METDEPQIYRIKANTLARISNNIEVARDKILAQIPLEVEQLLREGDEFAFWILADEFLAAFDH